MHTQLTSILRNTLKHPARSRALLPRHTSIVVRHNSTARALPTVCPSCHSPLPTPLPACPKCFHIEGLVTEHDFYRILDTPSTPNPFKVDPVRLKNSFRNIQRYIHPDIWTPHGERKVDVARDLSSLVNKAYNTLLLPVPRVQYILRGHGIDVSETDQLGDVGLITEVMEAREALEEAASEADTEVIKKDNDDKISETLAEIEALVESEDWDATRRAAVRLKYLQGIDDAVRSWPNAPFDH
ncbi:Co-chaperone Hsc20 [Auriscalpium vulgare]|uniref:Co-chaperone Hsc20 n=1 Tax=Auriscalpium vulgare TaxID=40419 RepID=A0ACB8RW42_9AGAM|nr:Co-chaperone Hsc20 [Auriscalpium vulgare]